MIAASSVPPSCKKSKPLTAWARRFCATRPRADLDATSATRHGQHHLVVLQFHHVPQAIFTARSRALWPAHRRGSRLLLI